VGSRGALQKFLQGTEHGKEDVRTSFHNHFIPATASRPYTWLLRRMHRSLCARAIVRVIQTFDLASRLLWVGVRRALEVVPPLPPEGRVRTVVHLVVAAAVLYSTLLVPFQIAFVASLEGAIYELGVLDRLCEAISATSNRSRVFPGCASSRAPSSHGRRSSGRTSSSPSARS
jgi:hypothetical protein